MAAFASATYGVLVRLRNRAYDSGRLTTSRLASPVVSIGNLSVGGTGKTPAVIAIGAELQRRGLQLDVLTRGYGRHKRELEIVLSGNENPDEVGDEPLVIHQQLRCPVLVDADRFRAGNEGERRFQTQLHLLDDGFQHRQLARDFDIVLVTNRDLNDRLLPAGRLREPLTALRRASALLAVGDDSGEVDLARLNVLTAAPVFPAQKQLHSINPAPGDRVVAFCGLARPQSFWTTLSRAGIQPLAKRQFRDHHRYTPADVASLRRLLTKTGAESFVTTAKDAVKLKHLQLEPLAVVQIRLAITNLNVLCDLIMSKCKQDPASPHRLV